VLRAAVVKSQIQVKSVSTLSLCLLPHYSRYADFRIYVALDPVHCLVQYCTRQQHGG